MVYVFFDFDGTLTTQDSLKGFARYYWGKSFYIKFLMFLPYLLAFKLKLISPSTAKSFFIQRFYKGESADRLYQAGQHYAQNILPTMENPAMMKRLKWHQHQGHHVTIVTASLTYWLDPWCAKQGIPLIATKASEQNGLLTGQLNGENCYGLEKVNRIRKAYHFHATDRIYAYGDTKSDYPMMDIATTAYDCSDNSHSPYILARKESWYAEAI